LSSGFKARPKGCPVIARLSTPGAFQPPGSWSDFCRAGSDLREKGRHAFAFSISATWPIYINLDSHQPLVSAFLTSRLWIAFAIAGVLAHERVHATGTPSESAGLFAEYELDRRFQEQGKLPREFDLEGMRKQ